MALAYAASLSAAAAAGEVKTETAKIPDVIYKGTVAAGQDLRGQVAAAGIEIVKAAKDRI